MNCPIHKTKMKELFSSVYCDLCEIKSVNKKDDTFLLCTKCNSKGCMTGPPQHFLNSIKKYKSNLPWMFCCSKCPYINTITLTSGKTLIDRKDPNIIYIWDGYDWDYFKNT